MDCTVTKSQRVMCYCPFFILQTLREQTNTVKQVISYPHRKKSIINQQEAQSRSCIIQTTGQTKNRSIWRPPWHWNAACLFLWQETNWTTVFLTASAAKYHPEIELSDNGVSLPSFSFQLTKSPGSVDLKRKREKTLDSSSSFSFLLLCCSCLHFYKTRPKKHRTSVLPD